jgi:hypothetical protein
MNDTPIETISKAIDVLAALRQAMTLDRPIDEDMLRKGADSTRRVGVLCIDMMYHMKVDINAKPVGT